MKIKENIVLYKNKLRLIKTYEHCPGNYIRLQCYRYRYNQSLKYKINLAQHEIENNTEVKNL